VILLDTNVLSELFRPYPDAEVLDSLDRWPRADVFLTAVTVAEIRTGVARMPAGRRKVDLSEATERIIDRRFGGRVLPFDLHSTAHYADLVADRFAAGRPISVADGQIAAICRQYEATLATRNLRDFDGMGLDLIDPWSARS
jgi:predicted nucleic acid-binding protein